MFNPITANLEGSHNTVTDTHAVPEYRMVFYKTLMGKELTDTQSRAFAAAQAEKRSIRFPVPLPVVPTTTLNEVVK